MYRPTWYQSHLWGEDDLKSAAALQGQRYKNKVIIPLGKWMVDVDATVRFTFAFADNFVKDSSKRILLYFKYEFWFFFQKMDLLNSMNL